MNVFEIVVPILGVLFIAVVISAILEIRKKAARCSVPVTIIHRSPR